MKLTSSSHVESLCCNSDLACPVSKKQNENRGTSSNFVSHREASCREEIHHGAVSAAQEGNKQEEQDRELSVLSRGLMAARF
jgi:hypothetical protein